MQIRWTGPAYRDFANICDYTAAHFGNSRAYKTADKIHAAIGSLETMPLLGGAGRKPGSRELVLADLPFVAVYRVRQDAIEVLRLLHGAQRWP